MWGQVRRGLVSGWCPGCWGPTSLAKKQLVEMSHNLQAAGTRGSVWVLAQNAQHAHQLSHSFEVLLWLQ